MIALGESGSVSLSPGDAQKPIDAIHRNSIVPGSIADIHSFASNRAVHNLTAANQDRTTLVAYISPANGAVNLTESGDSKLADPWAQNRPSVIS